MAKSWPNLPHGMYKYDCIVTRSKVTRGFKQNYITSVNILMSRPLSLHLGITNNNESDKKLSM